MNLRELVRRLEKIEDKAKQNKDKDTESMVGVLIEDLIEEDMKAEQEFREEVRKYIDKTIEEKVVEQAMYSGSIAQNRSYMSKFEDNGGYYIDGVPYMDCKYTGEPVRNVKPIVNM